MLNPIQLANFRAAVPAAQASAAKWHVPASVTLAQWIPESSWGLSKLAMRANNFFGVKCSHKQAPETYVEMPTAEYESGKRTIVQALFEKYPSAAASFDDHARLLATSARYRPAMAVASDPFKFAEQLQQCGYSTNPGYAAELQMYMRLYKLTQYDSPPPAVAVAQEKAA